MFKITKEKIAYLVKVLLKS